MLFLLKPLSYLTASIYTSSNKPSITFIILKFKIFYIKAKIKTNNIISI